MLVVRLWTLCNGSLERRTRRGRRGRDCVKYYKEVFCEIERLICSKRMHLYRQLLA